MWITLNKQYHSAFAFAFIAGSTCARTRARNPICHIPHKFCNLSIRETLIITWPYVRPSAPPGNQCEKWNFLASVGVCNLCLTPLYGQLCNSILWSINSCQNRVSVSRAQLPTYRGHMFFEVSTDQLLAFNWSQAQVYVLSHGSVLKLCIDLRIPLQWFKVFCL